MSASSWRPWVLRNGRLLPAEAAAVSPLGDGFMFGWGAFETLAVVRGRAAFFGDHAARLFRTATELGLGSEKEIGQEDEQQEEEEGAVEKEKEKGEEAEEKKGKGLGRQAADRLRERCARVIAANGLDEGSLKIVWFREGEGPGGARGELIAARGQAYGPEVYARGWALRTVPAGDGAGFAGAHKTLNYLRAIAERRQARAAGWDDSLWVGRGGEVLEGTAANLFAVEGGVLLTPALDGRILPGIARARVLALAHARAIPVEEGRIPLRRVLVADEVFVTNALVGVMPVARIDERSYNLASASVTAQLRSALMRAQTEIA